MPNLSLKGFDNKPTLVVAPTKVNLGISILMALVLPSVPITTSMQKSSIAE